MVHFINICGKLNTRYFIRIQILEIDDNGDEAVLIYHGELVYRVIYMITSITCGHNDIYKRLHIQNEL